MAFSSDLRAQVLANCRILYGEDPIEIITLYTESGHHQAVALQCNIWNGSWTKLLQGTPECKGFGAAIQSLLYKTETEMARRFSLNDIALPLNDDGFTVDFDHEERRDSAVSNDSSPSETSTFDLIPTPRSASPDEEVVEPVVDDVIAESSDVNHDEATVDTFKVNQHDWELPKGSSYYDDIVEQPNEIQIATAEVALCEEVLVDEAPFEEIAIEEVPHVEIVVESEPKPEPISEAEPTSEAESISEAEPTSEAESISEPEPLSETETYPQMESATEPTLPTVPELAFSYEVDQNISAEPKKPGFDTWSFTPAGTQSKKKVTFSDYLVQAKDVGESEARENFTIEEEPIQYAIYPASEHAYGRSSITNNVAAESDPIPVEDELIWDKWGVTKKEKKKRGKNRNSKAAIEQEVLSEPVAPVEDDPWAIWATSSPPKKSKEEKKKHTFRSVEDFPLPKPSSSSGDFNWGTWGTATSKRQPEMGIRQDMSPDHRSLSQAENYDFWNFAPDKGKEKAIESLDYNEIQLAKNPKTEPEAEWWEEPIKKEKKDKSRAIPQENIPEKYSAPPAAFDWDFMKKKLGKASLLSDQNNEPSSASQQEPELPHAELSVTGVVEVRGSEKGHDWLSGSNTADKRTAVADTWPSIISSSVQREYDDEWGTFLPKKSKMSKKLPVTAAKTETLKSFHSPSPSSVEPRQKSDDVAIPSVDISSAAEAASAPKPTRTLIAEITHTSNGKQSTYRAMLGLSSDNPQDCIYVAVNRYLDTTIGTLSGSSYRDINLMYISGKTGRLQISCKRGVDWYAYLEQLDAFNKFPEVVVNVTDRDDDDW